MGGTGSRVRFAYPGYMGAREALRGSPTVGGPAVHVRPVEAGRRLAAVRELVVVGVGGDGAVRVFVQQVVRAQGQRPAVAGLEAGRGVHRPRRAVGLVEGRVAALADAGGEFAVARRAQGEAPARSEEHTSELQSLMRISYAVFC